MYHKVDVIAPTVWWVSATTFAKQMDALIGREVVYLAEYDPRSDKQCVITFDDAYENIYLHALPILKERRFPFEVFVTGDLLGRWNHSDTMEPLTRHCRLEQLHELAAHGGRIQWHTRSHRNLATLDQAEVDYEISVPEDLRRAFPEPHMTWLAYPYGAHSPAVVDAVKKRFRGAVSVGEASDRDIFQLDRVIASEDIPIVYRLAPRSRLRRAVRRLRRWARHWTQRVRRTIKRSSLQIAL